MKHLHRVPSPFTEIGPGAAGGGFSARRSRRLHGLGSITADQAAQVAMPSSSISKTAGFTQTVYDDIVAAANNGNFTDFNPSGCSGIKASGATIGLTVGGALALKFAAMTGPAAPFVALGGAVAELFGAIFGHHAAAVAKERSVICAAVPAASDSLTAIDQAVQSGTLTPAQGISGLQNLLSSFTQTVQSILKSNSSQCNAACVWVKMLTAIVAKKSADYQDLAAAQAANPVGSALTQVESSLGISGLPSWALPAGIFAALWFMTN